MKKKYVKASIFLSKCYTKNVILASITDIGDGNGDDNLFSWEDFGV